MTMTRLGVGEADGASNLGCKSQPLTSMAWGGPTWGLNYTGVPAAPSLLRTSTPSNSLTFSGVETMHHPTLVAPVLLAFASIALGHDNLGDVHDGPLCVKALHDLAGLPLPCLPEIASQALEIPLVRAAAPEIFPSLCKCLGVTATKVVVTKTEPASSTTTTTATSKTTTTTTTTTLTTLPSPTTKSTTTTTTTSITATKTTAADACDISFNTSGNGEGNLVLAPIGPNNARECCVLCFNMTNCVASAFVTTSGNQCQLLVKMVPLAGAPITPLCPFGVEEYPFLEGPGLVFAGPCGGQPLD
ncbi:hypothetical protein QBC34DRAFT_442712 [Podospora aff. communis PSN243]|uniref:Apple domain-containing protein n=1 Tax=Podospora aff. communis PSN243 TaxID=3040156 RepID=A0AAV9G7U0_9PEZI|nr:hypothetical protein QBC34DRAFT_442712 [Podospora aff. communis PSN243]